VRERERFGILGKGLLNKKRRKDTNLELKTQNVSSYTKFSLDISSILLVICGYPHNEVA
jgi:hypothetical protein